MNANRVTKTERKKCKIKCQGRRIDEVVISLRENHIQICRNEDVQIILF